MDPTSAGSALAGIPSSAFLAYHIVGNVLTATCVLRTAPFQVHWSLIDIWNQIEGSRWWAWRKKENILSHQELKWSFWNLSGLILVSAAIRSKMGTLGKESEKQVKPAKRSFKRRIEGCTCVILISMQTNVALSATLSSNCTSNEFQAQAFSLKWQENTITYLVSVCSSENRYANGTPVPRVVVGLW